jgi:hypothetical protein
VARCGPTRRRRRRIGGRRRRWRPCCHLVHPEVIRRRRGVARHGSGLVADDHCSDYLRSATVANNVKIWYGLGKDLVSFSASGLGSGDEWIPPHPEIGCFTHVHVWWKDRP